MMDLGLIFYIGNWSERKELIDMSANKLEPGSYKNLSLRKSLSFWKKTNVQS